MLYYRYAMKRREFDMMMGEMHLKKLFPAMVRADMRTAAECRTLYEDQSGQMWCRWFGEWRKVGRVKVDNYPKDGITTHHYIVDGEPRSELKKCQKSLDWEKGQNYGLHHV